MKQITVLGAGMVGRAMIKDLSPNFNVLAADADVEAIKKLESVPNVTTRQADLSKAETIKSLANEADIVVNALPGRMGFNTLKTIIETGKNVADISFFPEDSLELDALAKSKGVTAVTDIGVAPGMGNVLCGYHHAQTPLTDYICYVGGLPFERRWPHEYKAPFSPSDVIEEYTRPARYKQNGHIVVRPALSEKEFLHFDEVGTLEAFNTDGLRSMLKTMDIPNMLEKTMRYPGTALRMETLREMGFFSEESISVGNQSVSPLEFTSNLLFPQWKLGDEEKEFTIMRVILKNQTERITYDLFDQYDEASGISSMARTTGYTCTAVVNLLNEGIYDKPGIIPPEILGADPNSFKYILNYLKARGVEYRKRVEKL